MTTATQRDDAWEDVLNGYLEGHRLRAGGHPPEDTIFQAGQAQTRLDERLIRGIRTSFIQQQML